MNVPRGTPRQSTHLVMHLTWLQRGHLAMGFVLHNPCVSWSLARWCAAWMDSECALFWAVNGTLSGEGPFMPYVSSFVQPSVVHAMSQSLPHRISDATVMGKDCIPSLWFTAAFSTLGSCSPDQGRLIKISTTHTLHISYTSLSRIPWILLS